MVAAIFVVASAAFAADEAAIVIATVPERTVQPDHAIWITITVLDAGNQPVDVDNPQGLVEIRDLTGNVAPYRPDVRRVQSGTYSATFVPVTAGTWEIVVAPDFAGVARVPSSIVVESTRLVSTRASRSGSTLATIALLVFVLLGAVFVVRAFRRPRSRRKASPEPEAHDTWWW